MVPCPSVAVPLADTVDVLSPETIPSLPLAGLVSALGMGPASELWSWIRRHAGIALLDAAPICITPTVISNRAERRHVHTSVESLCPALRTTVRDGHIFAAPRPNLAPLLELLAARDVHALLHFSFARPVDGAAVLELGVLDRDRRTKLHQQLRTAFKQLQGDTVARKRHADGAMVDESHLVVRWHALGKKGTAGAGSDVAKFYVHFVLEKRGVETHAAVKDIARALNVPPSALSFAGTKDRQAVTLQRMAVAQIDARALMRAAPQLEAKGLRVGSPRYARSQIQLGELSGNHFSLLLRDVRMADECAVSAESRDRTTGSSTEQQLRASVASVSSDGFVNYFGMQRFGVCGHQIGRCLLREDYDGAADLIIGFGRASEPTEVTAVRRMLHGMFALHAVQQVCVACRATSVRLHMHVVRQVCVACCARRLCCVYDRCAVYVVRHYRCAHTGRKAATCVQRSPWRRRWRTRNAGWATRWTFFAGTCAKAALRPRSRL